MSPTVVNNINWRGTNEGDALKAVSFGGNNSSGFTALIGGYRISNGMFAHEGFLGSWWSATEGGYGSDAWRRELNPSNSKVRRLSFDKEDWVSVRCVKD
jgi:uncharacterized protein (TIGR02145 family)